MPCLASSDSILAVAEKREEGGDPTEKSIGSSFGIIPPNRSVFPGMPAAGSRMMSAKNNLLAAVRGFFYKEYWW